MSDCEQSRECFFCHKDVSELKNGRDYSVFKNGRCVCKRCEIKQDKNEKVTCQNLNCSNSCEKVVMIGENKVCYNCGIHHNSLLKQIDEDEERVDSINKRIKREQERLNKKVQELKEKIEKLQEDFSDYEGEQVDKRDRIKEKIEKNKKGLITQFKEIKAKKVKKIIDSDEEEEQQPKKSKVKKSSSVKKEEPKKSSPKEEVKKPKTPEKKEDKKINHEERGSAYFGFRATLKDYEGLDMKHIVDKIEKLKSFEYTDNAYFDLVTEIRNDFTELKEKIKQASLEKERLKEQDELKPFEEIEKKFNDLKQRLENITTHKDCIQWDKDYEEQRNIFGKMYANTMEKSAIKQRVSKLVTKLYEDYEQIEYKLKKKEKIDEDDDEEEENSEDEEEDK